MSNTETEPDSKLSKFKVYFEYDITIKEARKNTKKRTEK